MYYGVDPIFPPSLLPVGQAKNDFNVTIDVKVSDNLGASVHTITYVKVGSHLDVIYLLYTLVYMAFHQLFGSDVT